MNGGVRRERHEAFETTSVALAEHENRSAVAQALEEGKAGSFQIAAEGDELQRAVTTREAVEVSGGRHGMR